MVVVDLKEQRLQEILTARATIPEQKEPHTTSASLSLPEPGLFPGRLQRLIMGSRRYVTLISQKHQSCEHDAGQRIDWKSELLQILQRMK